MTNKYLKNSQYSIHYTPKNIKPIKTWEVFSAGVHGKKP